MARSITLSTTAGLALTDPGDNPISVVSGVTVGNTAGSGLYSGAAVYWSITNAGSVTGSGGQHGSDDGIAFSGGGASVTNQGSASIQGYGFGISLAGAGTVVNQSRITAAQSFGPSYSAGPVTANGAGVVMTGGGVSNASTGLIAGQIGVAFDGSGTLNNAGSISGISQFGSNGYTYPNGIGVFFAGGSVTNAAHASIYGNLWGVIAYAALGDVANLGTIDGAGEGIMLLLAGGAVTNANGAFIQGGTNGVYAGGASGTVINSGAITTTNATAGSGVSLDTGGIVANNAATAAINGAIYGVLVATDAGTVTNQGTIAATDPSFSPIYDASSHTTAPLPSAGVALKAGGTVTNQPGGSIDGLIYGVAIRGAAASLANFGTILGIGATIGYITTIGGATISHLRASGAYLPAGSSVYNAQNGVIGGLLYGVVAPGGGLTATNVGSISGQKFGILSVGGGNISNAETGRISATSYGVAISGAAAGSVTNAGSILSTHFGTAAGVELTGGGMISNASKGLISATYRGAWIGSFNAAAETSGTVLNQGTITADDGAGHGAGVWIRAPSAYILNDTSSTIHGGLAGVVFYQQTTIVNRGTISGASSGIYAGSTVGTAANDSLLLEQAPGATIAGGVLAPTTDIAANTLELLSGSSAGVINGFGTVYRYFGQVTLDTGANWTLGGSVAAGQTIGFAGTSGTGVLTFASPDSIYGPITGFGPRETIALAGITDVSGVSLSATGNVLSVFQSSGPTYMFDFDPTQVFPGTFGHTTVGTATDLNVSCFAAGTLIRIPSGPLAVEQLAPGMHVLTHRGPQAEIVWIGHRAVDCQRHRNPPAVLPVRIRAGAFGPSVPARDLWLSPDHAVFIDDVLIPVRCLINGTSVRQEDVADVVYYHIELAEHDVILAEDLPVESYLDIGQRANFANGGAPVAMFPDFGARRWEMGGCAPLIQDGPAVEKAKRLLARRAIWVAGAGTIARLNNRYTYY